MNPNDLNEQDREDVANVMQIADNLREMALIEENARLTAELAVAKDQLAAVAAALAEETKWKRIAHPAGVGKQTVKLYRGDTLMMQFTVSGLEPEPPEEGA